MFGTYGNSYKGSSRDSGTWWLLLALLAICLAACSAPVAAVSGSRNSVVRWTVIIAAVLGGLAWFCLR